MHLADNPRPPLPEWITEAYVVLSAEISDSDTEDSNQQAPSIDQDRAVDILCATDRLTLEPGDANHAITRLLERGYFYEVDGELRVTLPAAE
ncbi:hypothetical protein CP556_22005 [Natrinema sp. CBA1119]|uniref:hypothetical protein n=1 Tax=Natrinema sp. CBA1119 TaxID=1608465 RepID=UPI000BF95F45|nr:hypothetical protein [Natrinema sp. CBA1119]PGF14368.1 hypothetical protein CP556_22005 [Natrinema sp. CBA1119]